MGMRPPSGAGAGQGPENSRHVPLRYGSRRRDDPSSWFAYPAVANTRLEVLFGTLLGVAVSLLFAIAALVIDRR